MGKNKVEDKEELIADDEKKGKHGNVHLHLLRSNKETD